MGLHSSDREIALPMGLIARLLQTQSLDENIFTARDARKAVRVITG
jgi:hypothetical protein